ncbi:MAG: GspE/PulE family protein, partial [Pseudomonadota bacterium]
LSPVARFAPAEGRISHRIDGTTVDLRLALAPCLRGDKLTIRIFASRYRVEELEELGLVESGLEDIQEWLDNVSGMLIVCGPTGSGKTTTLYTLLHKLKLHERNVMTVEDPVEYEIDGINHLQVDPRHGMDFSQALKAILRLDPDYLLVGEIRDSDSAQSAVTAASSGHAVMTTLHSRDAVGALDMLRNYALSGQDISSTLMLVVAQRLVRTLCSHCAEQGPPNDSQRRWLERLGREVPQTVWHPRGCEHCNDTGYRGRTGVFEVWRVNKKEYQLILNETDRYHIYQSLAQRGHRFLLDDGLSKAVRGITSLDELRSMGGYSALPPLDGAEG